MEVLNANATALAPRRLTKAARTRRRILDAAARLFSEKGYSAPTLKEIAEAADLKDGSLYYHFSSKEDLVDEVTRDGVSRAQGHIREALDALGPDASAAQRLRTTIRAHLESLSDLGDYPAAVLRIREHAPSAIRERQLTYLIPFGDFWAALIREAQAAGVLPAKLSAGLVRDLVFGAMHATVGVGEGTARSVDEVADALSELLGLPRSDGSAKAQGAHTGPSGQRGRRHLVSGPRPTHRSE
jgi:AcrR family transcriptional regulator